MEFNWAAVRASARAAASGGFDVRNTETIWTRSASACRRWMSQTSRLARHPFGAAAARLSHPAGASGGGGEGCAIPLVGQSEPGAVDGVRDETARIAPVTATRRQRRAKE